MRKLFVIFLLLFLGRISFCETVAIWNFNEGKGDIVIDESGNGYIGKIKGKYEWVCGRSGKKGDYAIRFDGKSGKVFVPGIENKSVKSLTFECWVNFDQLPYKSYQTIVATEKDFVVNLHVGRKDASWFGVFWINPETGDHYYLPAGEKHRKIKPGEWIHLAIVFDGRYMKIFINGVPDMYKYYYLRKKGEKQGKQTKFDNNLGVPYNGKIYLSKNFTLGCQNIGGHCRRWLNGIIDDVHLYTHPVKKEELGFYRDSEISSGETTLLIHPRDVMKRVKDIYNIYNINFKNT